MGVTIEKCLQAWTNSLKQMNAKADIVFFGDSLTYYGDFTFVFPDKVVCNLGLRGDTIRGMIDRVEQVKMLKPKVVYLMAGINDVAYCTMDEFSSLYKMLIFRLMKEIPGTRIIIQSLLPVNDKDFSISCTNSQIKNCNEVISTIASLFKFDYIDLLSLYVEDGELPPCVTNDGLHLKIEGYKKWYDLLVNSK